MRGDVTAPSDTASMTLSYLETGPNSASHTDEQKEEIFRGHMVSIQRLQAEGLLLLAGPFREPRNRAWRGVRLLDISDVEEARAVAATDPGVVRGEFQLVLRPVTAPVSLRQCARLERELQAELVAGGHPERKPGEPPPALRRYVMMHVEDFARAWKALAAPAAPRVIWWVRFRDGRDGVIVLDATEIDEAETALRSLDLGPTGLDRWMSTKSLERLRNER